MKIAAVSEDGITISQHFGRAPFYVVLSVESNAIVATEKREKLGHSHFAGETHSEVQEHHQHGFDTASQTHHTSMLEAVSDCQVLLARGMGAGAYESMKQARIQPVVTDIANIEEAVRAYLAGTLVDHIEKLH